ncbi:hypothetical protein P3X46_021290 [Hevea brasiliensis]|uniref:VQ domain-containing protein n=1 Tax=Hevea brasiliensis TaxID=3981 RepID=A0ABQ9LF27_HEVBR|nr:VQ motif-containing protein 9 [Hevea brasiliensis]KAJ9166552.1 hypothetical protein P3X46_021290 [Hevea brasiliensis]
MDKSCQSSGDSTITSGSSSSNTTVSSTRDQYLKNLNKLSHKISKPIITKKPLPPPPFDNHNFNNINSNANITSQPQQQPQSQQQQNQQAQQQQHQPPVYNINKNDFRDVVQKLTGSPAHERFSTPPPIHPPKPPSSRLQRIRPPPLAQVGNRPPPLINSAIPPHQLPPPPLNASINPPMPTAAATNNFIQRPSAPLSPLPPFPAVHAAAESPVSAYLRYLQNSISAVDSNRQFSGFSPLAPLVSPRWNNLPQQPPLQQNPQPFDPLQPGILSSRTSGMIASQPQFQLPTSPLPFGCLNSPRSPYPLLSPGLLLSPSSFPLSPTLPVPSPRWRAL